MFKIYDLNFKEVSLPVERLGYGIKALDISIGSIIYDTVYSNGNRADTPIKRYPKDREVSINILTTAADTIDWRTKRDELYSFFRRLGVFYVAESYQPFKLLKVMVDEGYEVDRPVTRWGLAEIPLKIIDTPFKQSLHTTSTIGSEGMLFNNKWAYGMGTWFAENYWQYEFLEGIPYNENLLGNSDVIYENSDSNIANYPILDHIAEGEVVTLSIYGKLGSGRVSFVLYNTSASSVDHRVGRVFPEDFDDELGAYVATFSWPTGANSELRVIQQPSSATSSTTITRIKLERGNVATDENGGGQESKKHEITFFNAGTEEVKFIQQKDSVIKVDIKSATEWFEIDDGNTVFRINKAVKNGDILTIKGSEIRLNGSNVLGDTNANFLEAKTGFNTWEVRNLRHFKISFDFRFLYD